MGFEDPRAIAFYGLIVTESRLRERLEAELEARTGISLSRLELLLHIHFEDGRRRMSDLAEALLLSRGGATRLVTKAEEEGLVTREIPADDRRATFAVLTDKGRDAAMRGMPVYNEVVNRLFGELSEEEAALLVRLFNRVLQANGAACTPITLAAAELAEK
jgi:DNA-binding MarR family transcriptional regulator